jgi:hypothetical protein
MADRFTPSTVGSITEGMNRLADELHVVGNVGAVASVDTATTHLVTPAQFLAGIYVNTRDGAVAWTLPTAAAMVAAVANAQVGSTVQCWLVNEGNDTTTITTNTGNTITGGHGTATLATALSQLIIGKFTNVTSGAEAVTYYPVLKAGQ